MLGGVVGAGIGFGAGGVGSVGGDGLPGVGCGPGFVGPGVTGGKPSGEPGDGTGVVVPGVAVGAGCAGCAGLVADGDSGTARSIGGGVVSAASAGATLGFDGNVAVDWPSSRVGVVSSSRVWLEHATPIAPAVSSAPSSARSELAFVIATRIGCELRAGACARRGVSLRAPSSRRAM
jgi:hypothetical protein